MGSRPGHFVADTLSRDKATAKAEAKAKAGGPQVEPLGGGCT